MRWTKEQEQVISLRGRNILVSAAAGSGKTATLVERIIQKVVGKPPMVREDGAGESAPITGKGNVGEGIATAGERSAGGIATAGEESARSSLQGAEKPVDIDKLLIVTFTRAAAAEMRERIGAAIEERRMQQPENVHLQRQALLLHSAQITTIDSFCLSVIRDYFHEIDLDPVFRVAEEEELTLLRHEVIADVLEEAYEEGEADFLSFAQNYGGKHQDLKLEDYILRLFQFSESCPWPEEWLKGLCGWSEIESGVETADESRNIAESSMGTEDESGNVAESSMRTADDSESVAGSGIETEDESGNVAESSMGMMSDARSVLGGSRNAGENEAADGNAADSDSVFSDEWLKKVAQSIKRRLSDALSWNRRALALCGDPDGPVSYTQALLDDAELLERLLACKDYRELSGAFEEIKFTTLSRKAMPDCAEEKKNLVKALRDQEKECIKGLKADFFFQDYEQMEEDERGAARYVRVLVRLTLAFREKFAEKKAEKRLLDFSDIEHFALNILTEKKDGVLVARTAALELRRRFEEIMVDEYQDSNEVQETILRSISREAEGKPNIFMVGDMKQSIYRFRLAKPELFLEKYNSYSVEDSKYQRIDLHKNFRSREEVLASVNEMFFRLMGKEFGQIDYDEAAALYPGAQYLERGEEDGRIDNMTELLLVPEEKTTPEEAAPETEDAAESLSADEESEEREYSKREKEAISCAGKIKEYMAGLTVQGRDEKGEFCLRPCRYGDIVILLRTMSGWAEVFAKVLMEQGIPAVSDTQSGYFNVPEIKWLLNYLRILDNPRQDIPYVNVLLSPFVGLTTDELAALRSGEKHVPLADAVRKCAAPYMEQEAAGQSVADDAGEDGVQDVMDGAGENVAIAGEESARGSLQGEEKPVDIDKPAQSVADNSDPNTSQQENTKVLGSEQNHTAGGALAQKSTGKRLADFLRIYDGLRERSRILSVPELLEELFAETGYDSFIAAMPAGGRRSKNLAVFAEKAAAFGQSSYRGLFQFIRYVERLIKYEVDYGEAPETAEGEDAVRIMSIHHSKGLEFPVVFVCGLTKKFNFTDMRERLLFHPDEGLAMDYIDERQRTVAPTLKKKVLKQQMEEEMLGEELRLLYVAMTRAKEKLCLIGYVENYGKLEEKWAATAPAAGEKLFYLTLSKARSYLDFIGPVLAGLEKTRLQLQVLQGESAADQTGEKEREFLRQQFLSGEGKYFEPDLLLLGGIRGYLDFHYPYAVDSELPFKVSVSELKRMEYAEEEFETPQMYPAQEAIPAGDEGDAEEANLPGQQESLNKQTTSETSEEGSNIEIQNATDSVDLYSYEGTLPEFLKEKQETKGTDRGTLYHRVLELLPLTEAPRKDTIKAGLEELVRQGRLQEEEIREISVSKLLGFYKSPVAKRMRAAEKRGHLYQEQPFVFALSAQEILKKESQEPILIQGIIDVFFEEEDGLVVLDYKTDYVPDEPEMTLKQRYEKQLALYGRALEEVTGKHVKEKILYSFYLGKEIVV